MESTNSSIIGKTAVYAVIGDPIDHSLSPLIQNAAFNSLGLDAVYVAFHVKQSALKPAVEGLRTLRVRGFNVTIPHKIKIMQYLDSVDRIAAEIGSVNTVSNHDESLHGHNTDAIGVLKALEEAGQQIGGRSLLLLGAGGAGRAVGNALAPYVKSMVIANRTLAKARQLARSLKKRFDTEIVTTTLLSGTLKKLLEEADIVVNASSMGMNGKADPPIKGDWLRKDQCIFDLVYKPAETRLLRLAQRVGAKTVKGLDLLVNQGACSFELWTGRKAPIDVMRRAIAQNLPEIAHATHS